jgi:hypothetical protein
MTTTLATLRDWVELALGDPTNLIWSTATLDGAIRGALAEISGAAGTTLTLNGLDGATETTLEDRDTPLLVVGASAYALATRLSERIEEATPDREDLDDLAKHKDKAMANFQALLAGFKRRNLQESPNTPYTQWLWEEGQGFG